MEDYPQYARRFYNGAVRLFNHPVQSFPHLLVARPWALRRRNFSRCKTMASASHPG